MLSKEENPQRVETVSLLKLRLTQITSSALCVVLGLFGLSIIFAYTLTFILQGFFDPLFPNISIKKLWQFNRVKRRRQRLATKRFKRRLNLRWFVLVRVSEHGEFYTRSTILFHYIYVPEASLFGAPSEDEVAIIEHELGHRNLFDEAAVYCIGIPFLQLAIAVIALLYPGFDDVPQDLTSLGRAALPNVYTVGWASVFTLLATYIGFLSKKDVHCREFLADSVAASRAPVEFLSFLARQRSHEKFRQRYFKTRTSLLSRMNNFAQHPSWTLREDIQIGGFQASFYGELFWSIGWGLSCALPIMFYWSITGLVPSVLNDVGVPRIFPVWMTVFYFAYAYQRSLSIICKVEYPWARIIQVAVFVGLVAGISLSFAVFVILQTLEFSSSGQTQEEIQDVLGVLFLWITVYFLIVQLAPMLMSRLLFAHVTGYSLLLALAVGFF